MEYAVVEIGGNQYKVKKDDIINTDFSLGTAKKAVKFDKVVMYHIHKNVKLVNPYIKGASVSCEIVAEGKSRKIIIYKYKRRKSSKFKKGHRQRYVTLKIKDIKVD